MCSMIYVMTCFVQCPICTGHSTAAGNPGKSDAVSRTYEFTTPQDKIRRTQSGPSVQQQSHEKTSMPSNHRRPVGRAGRTKKHKKHVKKQMKADGQKEATGKTAPNAPAAQPGNSNVPQTAETGNPPDGGATTVAKPAETALPETGAPKNPRKTAAKSMAVPVKTEGDDGEDTESDADDETKEEPAETPGPPSAVRERHVATAATENLRRPATQQQLAATPQPAPDASNPDPSQANPANAPGPEVTPETSGGRKKRREKTAQEKANHARYVKFSRHIKSA